jgi:hypothetical protein
MITTQYAQKHSTSAPRPSIIPSGSAGPHSHSFGEMHTDVCSRTSRMPVTGCPGASQKSKPDWASQRRRICTASGTGRPRATPLLRVLDDHLGHAQCVEGWRVTERGARLAGTVVARKFLVPPRVHAGGRQPQAGQPGSRLPLAGQDCWRRAGGA